MLEKVEESELESIVGGEFISPSGIVVLLTTLAALVAIYKMTYSNKGKAKIGNDFTFEWSWAR